MTSSETRACDTLRDMITGKIFAAGDRITEVHAAEVLQMSRTPVRGALRTLENEGYIKKRKGRGYTVLTINEHDLESVLKMCGVIEGYATSQMASRGISDRSLTRLKHSLAQSQELVDMRHLSEHGIRQYIEANTLFHSTIMEEFGNPLIMKCHMSLRHVPKLCYRNIIFEEDNLDHKLFLLRTSHIQHQLITEAILKRDGLRAEMLMRAHIDWDKNQSKMIGATKDMQLSPESMNEISL